MAKNVSHEGARAILEKTWKNQTANPGGQLSTFIQSIIGGGDADGGLRESRRDDVIWRGT